MKSLPWIFALFFSVTITAHAQTTSIEDDFEGDGTISNWVGDDCNIDTDYANPFPQGINTSNTVLAYEDVGGQYANVRFEVAAPFDLTNGNIFSLKIYVPTSGLTGSQPLQVSLKLQDGTLGEPWSSQTEIIKPLIADEWQTVTFDFAHDNYRNLNGGSPPPMQRTDLNRVVIQVNGEDNNDRVVAYIDDVAYDDSGPDRPVFDQLVWSDEFDTDGPIDDSKWFAQSRIPNGRSWFNGEIQHYTDRTDNARVEDGVLRIIAKRETFTDQGQTKNFTSARLNSKFAFQYGRVEIRAKLPSGAGTWPALWMLGKNINEDGAYWDNQGFDTTPWPACGEIDIIEHWGDNQDYVSSALHTPSSFGATENYGGRVLPGASAEFHTYTAEWTEERIVFSVDGIVHYTYNPAVKNADTWPFDAEQYLILNIAILPIISPSFTSSSMDIDYVRVYQQGAVSTTTLQPAPQLNYYPNPINDELRVDLPPTTPQVVQVELFSADGQLLRVAKEPVDNQQLTLRNLEGLPNGLYLIHFTLDRQEYSLKVIKQ